MDQAITDYNQAIELNSQHAGAHNDLGLIYEYQDELDEAISQYEQAVKLNARYDEAHLNLACAFSVKFKVNNALRYLRRALELDREKYLKLSRTPRFDNIKSYPDFQALIIEFEEAQE